MASKSSALTWLLRIAAVLWVFWGLVHMIAGGMTLSLLRAGDTTQAVHNIVSAADIAVVTLDYPAPVSAILSQHGFNLLWFGAVTTICAPFVWRGNAKAIVLASLVGGLADMGYFLFIDLGGHTLPPGPQMTWICAAAIIAGVSALRIRAASAAAQTALRTST